jgi:hypothetical protein
MTEIGKPLISVIVIVVLSVVGLVVIKR